MGRATTPITLNNRKVDAKKERKPHRDTQMQHLLFFSPKGRKPVRLTSLHRHHSLQRGRRLFIGTLPCDQGEKHSHTALMKQIYLYHLML